MEKSNTIHLSESALNMLNNTGSVLLFAPLENQPEFQDGLDGRDPTLMDDGTFQFKVKGYDNLYDYPVKPPYAIGGVYRVLNAKGRRTIFEARVSNISLVRIEDVTVEKILDSGLNVKMPPICEKSMREPSEEERARFNAMPKEKQDVYIHNLAKVTYMGWCHYADSLLAKFHSDMKRAASTSDLHDYVACVKLTVASKEENTIHYISNITSVEVIHSAVREEDGKKYCLRRLIADRKYEDGTVDEQTSCIVNEAEYAEIQKYGYYHVYVGGPND